MAPPKSKSSSGRGRPNSPTTLSNPQQVAQVPPFRSRRTIADHVHDNMQLARRTLFLHRIVVVCRSHESKSREEVFNYLVSAIGKLNENAIMAGAISGIVLVYPAHAWFMLTGAEYLLGGLKDIVPQFDTFFKTSRVVVFYNNANQRFTDHLVFRIADPPTLLMKNPTRTIDQLHFHTRLLLKKILAACTAIADDDNEARQCEADDEPRDEGANQADLKMLLPEIVLIDYVLDIDLLLTFGMFVQNLENINKFDYYDEKVWPIPYDFTPDNVYDNGKYDVNLIFGKQRTAE